MTTPLAVDAPRLQPKDQSEPRPARDVSINEFTWAASPRIFNHYVLVQTSPCLKGASNHHVC